MDPLSITASVIACIGAASSAIDGLRKLKDIHDAPKLVNAIVEELEDFRRVLKDIDGGSREYASSEQDAICRLLLRANEKLSALDHIIQGLRRSPNDSSGESSFSRTRWLKERSHAEKLRSELREIRNSLAAAVVVSTRKNINAIADDIQNLELATRAIVEDNMCLKSVAVDHQTSIESLHSLIAQQSALLMQSIQNQTVLGKLETGEEDNHDHIVSKAIENGASSLEAIDSDEVGDEEPSFCTLGCGCLCHSFSQIASPRLINAFWGQLLIQYPSQVLSSSSCSITACKKNLRTSYRVSYRFPAWLMQKACNWTIATGPEPILRYYAVLDMHDTDLTRYVSNGDNHRIRAALSAKGATPFVILESNGFQMNLLQLAVKYGHISTIRLILGLGIDPYMEASCGSNTYLLAIRGILKNEYGAEQRIAIKRLFWKPGIFKKFQFTILHRAVLGLTSRSVTSVLESWPWLLNAGDVSGETALHWALMRLNIEAMRTLIEYGADLRLPRGSVLQDSPLATKDDNPEKALEILLEAGADVRFRNIHGETALHSWVIEHDRPQIIELFGAHGADINAIDNRGNCPLLKALHIKHYAAAIHLIRLGAAPNLGGEWERGSTPLHWAGFRKAPPTIAGKLLDAGADRAAIDIFDRQPLDYAIEQANYAVVEEFLRRDYGDTERAFEYCALRLAIMENNSELLKSMLRYGIDLVAGTTMSEFLPLRLIIDDAVVSQCDLALVALFDYFKEHGTDLSLNELNEDGYCFWYYLARYADVDTIEACEYHADLRGADLNIKDSNSATPLEVLKMRSDFTEDLEDAFLCLIEAAELANQSDSGDSHVEDDDFDSDEVYEDARDAPP